MKKLQFSKCRGLIPAIIQDATTNSVLMLGFMNKTAYEKTRATKRVTFYSRSKKRLWTKGETSGNFLETISISADCDSDTLLIKVKPRGPTCHTGAVSCFGRDVNLPGTLGEVPGRNAIFLETLLALIKERKRDMPNGSYTASLFRDGISKIGAKIAEEAEEVVRAAQSESKARTVEEVSDLLYHLTVLMAEIGMDWSGVGACLFKRRR